MARFTSLPIELRLHIWSFVAPEVRPLRAPRVIALDLRSYKFEADSAPYHIIPTQDRGHRLTLPRGVSTMLSVHRESRAEALRYFPHVLTVDDQTGATVRFDRDRDLVLLNEWHPRRWDNDGWVRQSWDYKIPNFTATIRHLAVNGDMVDLRLVENSLGMMMFLRPFVDLVALYICTDLNLRSAWPVPMDFPENDYRETRYFMRWRASDRVNRFRTTGRFPTRGTGNVYCWPDIVRNASYAVDEDTVCRPYDMAVDHFEILVYLLLRDSHLSPEEKESMLARIEGRLSEEDLWRLSDVEIWKMNRLWERSQYGIQYLDPDFKEPARRWDLLPIEKAVSDDMSAMYITELYGLPRDAVEEEL